jgi:serine/threonine protein kinase/tetratricopeptide (TPR) repeat protein
VPTNDPPNDPPNHPDNPSAQETTVRLPPSGTPATDARQIGPYRLSQVLGEGGMGEVWLAEQTAPIHRTVALKLIKAGMDTRAVVARFESERQALALMDHPSIARVFDAGSTAEGRPYFVMEYVPGIPITEYCDKHRFTIKERLELFMQVCGGVQHAHQKAIIHRDLKPSNVLVVEQENKAVPKIIDFGLAKATAQRLTDKTMYTELGIMLGTPAYMSPEQADQREQNIDTRTDVYSLGVILYQLLVGALPFEAKALQAAGLEAILRVIREQDPPKPSTKIRAMGEISSASAENRKEEPRSFARHLQGELDWITMKALEKDRVRRYGTPSDLSSDISRYLRKEPVVAGPATAAYRLRKYAVRHRIALGAAAGLLLLLTGFTAAQAVQLHRIKLERDRATRERDRATRERDRAARITDFMTGIFKVSDPSEARGNTITAREILDKASTDIDTGLTKDPELQAQMMYVMGDVYDNLGLYPRAELLEQHGMEIRRRVLGAESPETLQSTYALVRTLEEQGRYPEAETLQRQTLDVQRRVLGPQHPDTLASMRNFAAVLDYEGHYAESEKLNRETLGVQTQVLGPHHPETLKSMNNLAKVLAEEGHYAEAEKLFRETLDASRHGLGPEHPFTQLMNSNLALILDYEGHYAEAEKLSRESVDADRRLLGPDHPRTLESMNNLAKVLIEEGHYSEGEKLDRETLDIRRRVLGSEHPLTLGSIHNLAVVLGDEGHYVEAEKLERETLDVKRRILGPEHPETLQSMSTVAEVLDREGHFAEAERLARETLDIQRRVLQSGNRDIAVSTYILGSIASHRGRRDQALSLLLEAVDHGLPQSADLAIDKDPGFNSLHGDPRFVALVAHAKERAAAQNPN